MIDKKKTINELIDNIFTIKKNLLHETVNRRYQNNHYLDNSYDDCCTNDIIVLINEFLDLCLLAIDNTLGLPKIEDYSSKERHERHERLHDDIANVINSLRDFMAEEMASRAAFDRSFEEVEKGNY